MKGKIYASLFHIIILYLYLPCRQYKYISLDEGKMYGKLNYSYYTYTQCG